MAPQDTDPSTPTDDAVAAERAARAADRGRIVDIEAQILELERTLSSLYEEKNSLRDRLATYTYPVLTLPNEIVSTIFLHFLPNFPEHPPPIGPLSPYLLCQICRQWRHIAFATPPLWSVISLSLGKVGRLPHKLRYLTTFRLVSDLLQTGEPDNGQFKSGPNHRLWCSLGVFGTIFPVSPFFCQHGTSAALCSRFKARGFFAGVDRDLSGGTFITTGRPQKLSQSRQSRFAVVPVNGDLCGLDPTTESPQCNVVAPGAFILDDWFPPDGTMSRILGCLTLPALRRLQVREMFFTGDDPINPLVSLVARSGCNLRELSVLDANMPRQKYCDAFPVASIMLNEQLAITEPFLNFTGWKDGEETESADSEASDSDEE